MGRTARPRDAAEEATIIRRYLQHVPIETLYRDHGLNQTTLYTILDRYHIPRRNKRVDRAYPAEQIVAVLKEALGHVPFVARPTAAALTAGPAGQARTEETEPIEAALLCTIGSLVGQVERLQRLVEQLTDY